MCINAQFALLLELSNLGEYIFCYLIRHTSVLDLLLLSQQIDIGQVDSSSTTLYDQVKFSNYSSRNPVQILLDLVKLEVPIYTRR